ncbi:UNVERIFIED_CONTAM: hypothetical protein Sradi_5616200 [Sesamum radiatum]|uniref:Uncharacterized protein n=1 Tax=Sesamum radiatum TaxID=300843 RepID=A0AAW2L047_SESRA
MEIVDSSGEAPGRVLRVRYFPNGDVFSATLGSRPSYTWRSILAAQTLFRRGANGKWVQEGIFVWGPIPGFLVLASLTRLL